MTDYPEIEDDDFYSRINKIYKQFVIPEHKRTMKEICFPKKYSLQLPQQFLSQYINPKTPYKGILIYHRIGAGKTCTAVRIAEKWKRHRNIIVVLPASLKGNFRTELRSLCAENNYLKQDERKILDSLHPTDPEYRNIIDKSDERIDKVYNIYSYNKFIEMAQDGLINLKNSLLIIDEIQNMVSEKGTYYGVLYDLIHDAPDDLRIVLMSATPMFDKPSEIALTMNLLRIPEELPIGKKFDRTFIETYKRAGALHNRVINIDYFKDCVRGYVSYFRGAPPYVFPDMVIKYVKCEMSPFQYRAYLDVLKTEQKELKKRTSYSKLLTVKNLPNNFFIGTRIVSNIVFPNRKINEAGFESLKGTKITEKLSIYSTKFDKIIRKIENSHGKVFIYSGFKSYGGIKSFCRILDEFGYKNYSEEGEGMRRYAVWSGDETITAKDEIRAVYNHINNLSGHKIKILLGTPSIKEGVSLTAVQQVHILEPYWNQSRLDQVIGRASRYCSHKDVPEEKRLVKVYVYVATRPNQVESTDLDESEDLLNLGKKETVDQYIQQLSIEKNRLVKEFEKALKEVAVDCTLNKNANVYEDESDIVCEV